MLVIFDTSHRPKSAFIELAPMKVPYIVVTSAVFHCPMPLPVKADAWLNVIAREITLDVIQLEKSASMELAPRKVWYSIVKDDVVHLLIAAPTNVAALGLPFATYAPPASLRSLEKAWLKSFTPRTSQLPRVFHLIVAAVEFWTQSQVASLNVVSVSGTCAW